MIDKIYIDEAIRIREEYLKNLIYLTQEEENIKSLTSDLEQIQKDVEKSNVKDESFYRNALMEIEVMISKALEKIMPFDEKKKELDKKQRNLYNIIKEKYPTISDNEIQDDIIPHIIKIDKKYKDKYGHLLK
jgi:hypothetical protein